MNTNCENNDHVAESVESVPESEQVTQELCDSPRATGMVFLAHLIVIIPSWIVFSQKLKWTPGFIVFFASFISAFILMTCARFVSADNARINARDSVSVPTKTIITLRTIAGVCYVVALIAFFYCFNALRMGIA